VLCALALPSFAAVRGLTAGTAANLPAHRGFDAAASGQPLASTTAAAKYPTTNAVSWVIGGRGGRWYTPLRCQMLINGRWADGRLVDWDGQWNAYAWYNVRSGQWYKQAAQFRVGRVYRWYYSWAYVGYRDAWGWYDTDDWVVAL